MCFFFFLYGNPEYSIVVIVCIYFCQILVDSAIDLEVPAHKTSGFVAYVYPAFNEQIPSVLNISIPIHGRYHQPSFHGETFESIAIEPPKLLLRTEKCK